MRDIGIQLLKHRQQKTGDLVLNLNCSSLALGMPFSSFRMLVGEVEIMEMIVLFL